MRIANVTSLLTQVVIWPSSWFVFSLSPLLRIAVLVLPMSAAGQVALETLSFPLGPGVPSSAAVGDLDGDRWGDIIVANGTTNLISVLLGNGDGSVRPKRSFATGKGPAAIGLADFNRDGNPDAAVANGATNTVSVFLGKRDGSFGTKTDFVVDPSPNSLVIADFNRDGFQDIATPSAETGEVSILLGKGTGTFTSAVNSTAGSLGISALRLGDFNRDGITDLAMIANVSVILIVGTGNGHFTTFTSIDLPGRPEALEVADFNRDGSADVAATFQHCVEDECNSGLLTFLNEGSGNFLTKTQRDEFGPLASADFNRDGIIDLLVGDAVLFGVGDGSFRFKGHAGGGITVAVGDLNRDGIPDLADAEEEGLDLLLGKGDGTFARTMRLSGITLGDPEFVGVDWVGVSDFNRDGILDVASTKFVQLGRGDATFRPPLSFNLATCTDAVWAAIADLNGDQFPDIALACGFSPSSAGILIGNGDGTFKPALLYATGPMPYSIAVADFNGDGVPDLVTGNTGNDTTSVLLNRGDGTFGNRRDRLSGGIGPFDLLSRDFNRDGKQDFAVANLRSGIVTTFLGNGDGGFQPPITTVLDNRIFKLTSADYNRDGVPDLAVTIMDNQEATVLFGAGDGTFPRRLNFFFGNRATFGISSGDFNKDGNIDLAIGNSARLSILLSNGDTSFKPTVDFYRVFPGPTMPIGDFNRDGLLDIVANTAVQRNRGASELRLQSKVSAGTVSVGSTVTYTLTVQNPGPNYGYRVIVTDILPASLKLISYSTSQGFCSGSISVSCNLGKVSVGATPRVTVIAKVKSQGYISNTARVSGFGIDSNKTNNYSTAVVNAVQ
jgi:uncharacterized repeat protein (TIGR01451 family)